MGRGAYSLVSGILKFQAVTFIYKNFKSVMHLKWEYSLVISISWNALFSHYLGKKEKKVLLSWCSCSQEARHFTMFCLLFILLKSSLLPGTCISVHLEFLCGYLHRNTKHDTFYPGINLQWGQTLWWWEVSYDQKIPCISKQQTKCSTFSRQSKDVNKVTHLRNFVAYWSEHWLR